jgi:hypothetical protein
MTWTRKLAMSISEAIAGLPARQRRGSRPRCLLLTNGSKEEVAHRLTGLVQPYAEVTPQHLWMPQGFADTTEARLGRSPGFLTVEQQGAVTAWWLVRRRRANTPNWDVACSATIEGQEGLILVEAKAHSGELKANGKRPGNPDNHAKIGAAIQQANAALNAILPGWSLSRDAHYQLANRFAWAWKIASLGIPVILVYLGFLCAEEMRDQGDPFADAGDWEAPMREQSRGIAPETAWEECLRVQGTPLRPMLRSLRVDLPEEG